MTPVKNILLPQKNRRLRRAFTLVELMLSIALVLVLMIGVSYIFRTTSDAVGAGQTINTMARDSQSTQTLLFDDFRNISKNPPCFIIASQLVTQFLNTDDAQGGPDPTQIILDNNGSVQQIANTPPSPLPGFTYSSPALYGYRNHRADMVRFFAHGNYTRRTANDGSFSSTTTAQDAFITIGHALLPTYDHSMYVGPTTDSPANNIPHVVQNAGTTAASWTVATDVSTVTGNTVHAGPLQRVGSYATDWVLARNAVLLADPAKFPTPVVENYFARIPNNNSNFTGWSFPGQTNYIYQANLTPFACGSLDNTYYKNGGVPNNTNAFPIQSSRFDMAGVTPDQFRQAIADEIIQWETAATPYSGGHLWWNPLVYNLGAKQTNATGPLLGTGSGVYTFAAPTAPTVGLPPAYQFGNWSGGSAASAPLNSGFTQLQVSVNGSNVSIAPDLARSACNPLLTAPLTSAAVAQMSPYLLEHCSQFIVEYAGDYLQQDISGALTGLGPDGQIDFVVDANNNRHIRWYGMPRSASGNGVIRGYNGTDDPTTAVTMQSFTDVIPLRDYYTMYLNHAGHAGLFQPPWEVDINFDPPGPQPVTLIGDYANPAAYTGSGALNNKFQANNRTDQTLNARYVCAWYNDMPAMVRILIKVDDPNNKLKDGPWYEYVFKLK